MTRSGIFGSGADGPATAEEQEAPGALPDRDPPARGFTEVRPPARRGTGAFPAETGIAEALRRLACKGSRIQIKQREFNSGPRKTGQPP